MTKQLGATTVVKETASTYHGKPVIIELRAGYMLLRTKHERESHMLPYDTALETALKIEALEMRRMR